MSNLSNSECLYNLWPPNSLYFLLFSPRHHQREKKKNLFLEYKHSCFHDEAAVQQSVCAMLMKSFFCQEKKRRELCLIAASALSCGAWKECTVWSCHLHHQCTNEADGRKQSHHIRVLQRRCGGGIYSEAINTFRNSTVVLLGSTLCRC